MIRRMQIPLELTDLSKYDTDFGNYGIESLAKTTVH